MDTLTNKITFNTQEKKLQIFIFFIRKKCRFNPTIKQVNFLLLPDTQQILSPLFSESYQRAVAVYEPPEM